MTNVGEVMGPRTFSPAPSPWANVVLPAPSSPLSTTRSPARSCPASERPRARIESASGTSNRKVLRGRRSSTFGSWRRTSRKPRRSQKPTVAGSSSRATTVRSSNSWASVTAAWISRAAMPCPCAWGRTPKRRTYMVVPTGSRTRPPTGSPSSRASNPPRCERSSANDATVSVRAAAGGSSGGRASKAGRMVSSSVAASAGPTGRISTLTGGPPAPGPRRAAGRARR